MSSDGSHPNSRKNLELGRFKKGENGSKPASERHSGLRVSTVLKRLLDETLSREDPLTGFHSEKKAVEFIGARMIKDSIDGNEKCTAIIMDRTEGPLRREIDLNVSDSEKIDVYADQVRKNLSSGLGLLDDIESIEEDEDEADRE